ncbi:MAG: RDD family protein [Candidatus Zixiibacteriota bacterium]
MFGTGIYELILFFLVIGALLILLTRTWKVTSGTVSKWRRLTNGFVDMVAALVLSILIDMAFTLLRAHFVNSKAQVILTIVAYYLVCEYFFGRTIGKAITHTEVLSANGQKPSFGQVAIRTLVRFIPIEPLSILFSSQGKGWHDSWSRTQVVPSAKKANT